MIVARGNHNRVRPSSSCFGSRGGRILSSSTILLSLLSMHSRSGTSTHSPADFALCPPDAKQGLIGNARMGRGGAAGDFCSIPSRRERKEATGSIKEGFGAEAGIPAASTLTLQPPPPPPLEREAPTSSSSNMCGMRSRSAFSSSLMPAIPDTFELAAVWYAGWRGRAASSAMVFFDWEWF